MDYIVFLCDSSLQNRNLYKIFHTLVGEISMIITIKLLHDDINFLFLVTQIVFSNTKSSGHIIVLINNIFLPHYYN